MEENIKRLEEIKSAFPKDAKLIQKAETFAALIKEIRYNFVHYCYNKVLTTEIIKRFHEFNENEIYADYNAVKGYLLLSADADFRIVGSTEVVAINNAKVEAYKGVTVRAYNDAEVVSYSAFVIAKEYSCVKAYSCSHVEAYDNTDIDAYDNSCIISFGETNIHAHNDVHIMLHNSDYVWATDNVFIKSLFKPKKMCLRNAAINFAQQEYKVYYSSLSTLKFEKTK